MWLNTLLSSDGRELLAEADVRAWAAASPETNLASVPAGAGVSAADVQRVKASKGWLAFLAYLDAPAEDESEEDEE